ncbi:MAG: DnaD domain protein, partial [Oscillospiraceae bacterium]|nr:DnaD domain protein [Oscillospiraceae bacterium]
VGGGAVRAGAPAEKAEPPLPPAEELPQYTAAEIARHKQDGTFSAVLDEAAKVMGRNLSGNDMRVLFGVYDHLGLPGEVLMELLNYLGEVYRERYGEGRRPTAHAIETEAYVWARQELLTFEQAEEYIRAQKRRFGELSRLQTQLDIRGRGLGKTERRYLNEWLDLGFEEEAIALAYDRTLTATGKLSWPYMNGILRSWHQQGLHGAREIEEKDGRGRRKGPARKADEPVDLEALQRAVDKI